MIIRIADVDLCATCEHLRLVDAHAPPAGQWDMDARCSEGFPYSRVDHSANAIAECPRYRRSVNLTTTGPL